MVRHSLSAPRHESPVDARERQLRPAANRPPDGANLADLPVAGLTRRRIGLALCALVAAWVIVLFARQVGEASEAVARAESVRASNAALSGQITALQGEVSLVAQQRYVSQQARRYRLGTAGEIPFRLADNAPPLAAGAPGSESVRLGGAADQRTPLESWLVVLFGPPAAAG